jgi:hypothetical protein
MIDDVVDRRELKARVAAVVTLLRSGLPQPEEGVPRVAAV